MTHLPSVTEPNEFDVYQSDAGYVAVTNETRRQILAALAKKERELNDLVKITGKAKPTLSNLHVKELLAQNLVEELPHPTDQRKKIYRLKGQRIGSSSIPIDQLRGAVKHYVSISPLAHAVPLQQVLDILLAGGPKSHETLARQAMKLGEISSQLLTAGEPRDFLQRVASYWEREGITRTVNINLEDLELDLNVNPRYGETKEAHKLVATLLAGFLEGAMQKLVPRSRASGEVATSGRVRVRIDK